LTWLILNLPIFHWNHVVNRSFFGATREGVI
jgi:hypothetical protein